MINICDYEILLCGSEIGSECKSVSGRINSSASSPRVLCFSFSPSFRLSLSFCNNNFERARRLTHSEKSSVPAVIVLVRSRKNLHTCKLTLAGSRSPDIKYGAWGSHAWFSLLLYRPDTSVRALNVQVRYVHYIHRNITEKLDPRYWNWKFIRSYLSSSCIAKFSFWNKNEICWQNRPGNWYCDVCFCGNFKIIWESVITNIDIKHS